VEDLLTEDQVRAWIGNERFSIVCEGGRCFPLRPHKDGPVMYTRDNIERGICKYLPAE
jgi:hypothetical protein